MQSSKVRVAVAAALSVLALAACSGGSTPASPTGTSSTTGTPVASPTRDLSVATTAVPHYVAATVKDPKHPISAHTAADGTSRILHTFPGRTTYGAVTSFLVDDTQSKPGWFHVRLAMRPAGSQGWIKTSEVTAFTRDSYIVVNTTSHTIAVTVKGKTVSERVAVGTDKTPTPLGTFWVTDLVDTTNPAYAPFALGLSARSEVLTEFGSGDGQIGIHGTNDAASVGKAVSHGCIRVSQHLDGQLKAWTKSGAIGLGTPVIITA